MANNPISRHSRKICSNKFFIISICIAIFIMRSCFATHKIAIEGLPGAGKSISLIDLIFEFRDRCILFSETNPEPNSKWQDFSASDQGNIFHSIWATRMQLVDILSEAVPCLLFDRSYYSNLAYKYASERYCGTDFYDEYIEIFNKNFRDNPEIGLLRRYQLGDTIAFPWTEVGFLNEFQKFYDKELIKVATCPIVTINTDNLSPSEVKARVRKEIQKIIGISLEHPSVDFSEIVKNQLLEFAKKNMLGNCHSEMINIFGYPTIDLFQNPLT